ncbi:Laminin subunit gamma-1 [Rhynchospora pubera]|uniref:Laminin subunit gamma-1 n=1 Tax=Rhynchospora pubera TaxID=906938 RepID=A0AAV8CIY4_9POAL|nr:Laminin subunit gamma-1 [Rhynchospora pubera]
MAGLLAWAADVVGGGDATSDEDNPRAASVALAFTPDQQRRADELDRTEASLRRSIQDLRLRIPPDDLAQRLPHLHADSVASNAALALQLNAHTTTKEQAQQRKVALQEENSAYEKAISNCKQKIQEKLQDADVLRTKLEELDTAEKYLKDELEKALKKEEVTVQSETSTAHSESIDNELEASRSIKLKDLDEKKKDLQLMEELVQRLEKEWESIQRESEKKPSAAQREKQLEKQLHSLIEQLTAKQAQAESIMAEIKVKEEELQRLNCQRRKVETGITEVNTSTRNRFGRSFTVADNSSQGYDEFKGKRRIGLRLERRILLRYALVVYILALHIIVFIRISF